MLWILQSRSIFWIVEQPAGSLLQEHPRMLEFFRSVGTFKVYIRMQDPIGTVDPRICNMCTSVGYELRTWLSRPRYIYVLLLGRCA